MAQQMFKQPGRRGRQDDSISNPQVYKPSGQNPYSTPDTSGTLSDIDNVLANNEQTLSKTSEELAKNERAFTQKEQTAAAQDKSTPTSEKIDSAEQAGDSSLYNPDGEKKTKKEDVNPDKLSGLKKPNAWVKRNKNKLMAGGIAGGVGGLITVFMGLMQFGPLLIPSLTFNMDDNRLTRMSRNMMISTDTIIKLKLDLTMTNDPAYRAALNTYRADGAGSFFAKVNSLRPAKITEQLLLDMDFHTTDYTIPGTNIKRHRVTAVTYGGERIDIPERTTGVVGRVTHPVKYFDSFLKYRKSTRALAKNLLLETDPDASKIKRLFQRKAVQSKAAKLLRERLSILPVRWTKAEIDAAYRDQMTPEEALHRATSDSHRLTTDNNSRVTQATSGDNLATEAAEQTAECVENPDCQRRMRQTGDTLAPQARDSIINVYTPNAIRTAIRTVSTVADLGYILCLVYDASVVGSRAVMQSNSTMAMATYASLAAAGNQQIYTGQNDDDRRVHPSLTGGYNDQINSSGGAAQSNIMREANGQPYDTSDTLSPQASAAGAFETDGLSRFIPSGPATDAFRTINNMGFCSAVGNPWIVGSIAVAELSLFFVPGINALKASGTATAKTVSTVIAKQFGQAFKQQFSRSALRNTGTLANAAQLTALAYQSVTMNRAGALYNGVAQGEEYLNQADAGAEVFAQSADGIQNASRPLTSEQFRQVKDVDESFRSAAAQTQSFSDRYASLHNPQSLLHRMAITTYTSFNTRAIIDTGEWLLQSAANVFNPSSFFTRLLESNGATSHANHHHDILTKHYGIVQRGWTEDEENAYRYDDNYAPFYNEVVLDESGRRDELMEKYGKCFDEDMTELLAGSSNPAIHRDANANVIADRGDCAPNRLGDSSPPNNGRLDFVDEEAELVFRLRVSIRNNNAVDDLLRIQEVPDD